MFQYVALASEKPWQPGPYPGVELKILHRHEATGGVVVLRKFHSGVTVPAHTHPLANEYAYVISERHGPHVARTEVISLTVFDGPLTVA
jgi:hypothetical protein